jgi:hypothetical protein
MHDTKAERQHELLAFSSKELLLFIPALGTAIAVTFDVGFFSGIGVSYFSLFSLSEHLVFALQALPVALIAAAMAFLLSASTRAAILRALQIIKRRLALNKKRWTKEHHSKTDEEIERLILSGPPFRISLVIFGTASIAAAVITYRYGNLLPAVSYAILGCAAALHAILPNALNTLAVRGMVVGVSGFVFTFTVGIERAKSLLEYPEDLYTISRDGGEVQGTLVRGGERGVLFWDSRTKQITFYRWDGIHRIVRARSPRDWVANTPAPASVAPTSAPPAQ